MTSIREYELESQSGIIVIDFWAPWCQPCKMMKPILQEISNEQHPFEIRYIDGEADATAAAKYGVMGFPTFVILSKGSEVGRFTGATPKAVFINRVMDISGLL